MRRHVYFYTQLEQDYAAVAAVLGDDPARWLPLPANAHADGFTVRLSGHGALPASVASHTAWVWVGPSGPGGQASTMLRSVAWQSATSERLVPVLEGDLELAPLGGSGCHLSLLGSYRPPLSVVGETGDRLLGHRLAEACVRRFVLDVAERLGASATLPA